MRRWPGPGGVLRRTASNARRAAATLLRPRGLRRGGSVWLRLRIGPSLDELRPAGGLGLRGSRLALLEILEALAVAERDPLVRGLLVELEGGIGGFAQRQALHRALASLRRAGKPVVVHAETLETGDLLLGSAASALWIAPAGSVHLTGLRAEALFLRGLLEQVHVAVDVVRVGTHKGAAETFTRDGMSPEHREQLEALMDDLFGALVSAVAQGRRLSPERVRALVDEGLFPARAAIAAGLVDDTCWPDQLEERVHALAGADHEELLDLASYHRARVADPGWLPLLRDVPRVAYVVARGSIRRGRGPRGIATEPLRTLLRRVRDDDRIDGVVLRLDSPGGDGLASDLLWRELALLARCKPLVVSMGDVAASGGYYLAMAGDTILAEAGTLTGSIGVVGGKLDLAGLYARLGVGRDAVERGARAGIFSETRGFTPGERSAVRREMEAVYETFVQRVADGRRLTPDAVERVAQGRVFSGVRALGLGLVDGLGGPLEALREVRRRAGLRDADRVVVEILPRMPRFANLRAFVGLALLGPLGGGPR